MRKMYEENSNLKVYSSIKNAIVLGEFSQGEKLIESDLVDKYKVSRYILRDVIKKLENEGYLEKVPNRGASVRKILIPEIEEVYYVLVLLEPKAAELAALLRDEKDINSLHQLLASMVEEERNANYVGWAEHNDELHLLIGELSRSNTLSKLITDLRKRIYRHRFLQSIVNCLTEYNDAHKKIIDFITNKNPDQAAEKMKLHLEAAKQNRINFLRKFSIT